ncbi:hypothetical protein K458DRAFT_19605 [Lentithecium fluviatile CBS 122367]|uniref:Uncharacterized protein n=1 Tax=Lentithecium fluviatile CBS 122367 TaxID=1168545 RepID=A0A6G1J499_9PLEO|nr:hypothetical protein K458DRAFT_19605 [Lentithecium fluviatile CBS 122367]
MLGSTHRRLKSYRQQIMSFDFPLYIIFSSQLSSSYIIFTITVPIMASELLNITTSDTTIVFILLFVLLAITFSKNQQNATRTPQPHHYTLPTHEQNESSRTHELQQELIKLNVALLRGMEHIHNALEDLTDRLENVDFSDHRGGRRELPPRSPAMPRGQPWVHQRDCPLAPPAMPQGPASMWPGKPLMREAGWFNMGPPITENEDRTQARAAHDQEVRDGVAEAGSPSDGHFDRGLSRHMAIFPDEPRCDDGTRDNYIGPNWMARDRRNQREVESHARGGRDRSTLEQRRGRLMSRSTTDHGQDGLGGRREERGGEFRWSADGRGGSAGDGQSGRQ